LSLEELAAQPDTTVTRSVGADGQEIVEIRRGGVVIIRRGNEQMSEDRSGRGAVMCMRGFLAASRAAMEVCGAESDGPLKTSLDEALSKIDDFVFLIA
jgi:hypothetical protein